MNNVFSKLFNANFKFDSQRKDELIVRINSKAITNFFKNIRIKEGRRVDDNKIPEIIIDADMGVKRAFLRGIFDTESSVTFKKNSKGFHHKPVIHLRMKSKTAIYQIKSLLNELVLEPHIFYRAQFDKRTNKIYPRYEMDIPGKKNLKMFLELVGFKDFRHLSKLEIWRRFGFYPPKLNHEQRVDILSGKLDPHKLY